MASAQNPPAKHVVLDACFVVAFCANQHGRRARAMAELAAYAAAGCTFYAPGVLISETLYSFCEMERDGTITAAERAQAVQAFLTLMTTVRPSPNGDLALVPRTIDIHGSYGCSRTADSIYLALTESLAQQEPSEIVTFDGHIENQAIANSRGVVFNALT
jgi:predicted nucleic acid-binding protein